MVNSRFSIRRRRAFVEYKITLWGILLEGFLKDTLTFPECENFFFSLSCFGFLVHGFHTTLHLFWCRDAEECEAVRHCRDEGAGDEKFACFVVATDDAFLRIKRVPLACELGEVVHEQVWRELACRT